MTQALSPDAGTICALLELDAGYLAEMFRREAASALREGAKRIEGAEDIAQVDATMLSHARHLLLIADALEDEWQHQEESDGAETERKRLPTPPPPSQDEIVPESRRAGA